MGGYEAIQSFSRLYMIAGLYHCPCGLPVDGDPATAVQLMPQLVGWVERGQAPARVVRGRAGPRGRRPLGCQPTGVKDDSPEPTV